MAYVLTMTIGVLSIGQEYRHQTITSTLLAVPRRATAMIAKVISLLGIGAFYGIISLIGSVAVGASILASSSRRSQAATSSAPWRSACWSSASGPSSGSAQAS